jgi:hypothetical protein
VTDALEEFTPETLTGEQVQHIREKYGFSRSRLAVMCGFPATGVRIHNIEKKNSWNPGNRETIAAVLTDIIANPPSAPKRKRATSGDSPKAPASSDGTAPSKTRDIGPVMGDDDPDDGVVSSSDPPLVPPGTHVFVTNVIDDSLKELTNSEVAVWQRCRRKWWLAVYRQLTLKQQDFLGHRARGNRVHRALAAWYVPAGQERTDPREALERAIVEDWTAIVAQARAHPAYDEMGLADLSARYNESVSLERAMVEGYMQWVLELGDDAALRVTAPETEVHATIEGKVADDEVRFRARALLDVRITRVVDGVRLFEDHKTVGNFTDPRKTLHMDPQMLHYHLLEFLNTAEGDTRCDGALYNMLRRVKRTAQAKPPFYERIEVRHNSYEIDAYRRRLLGIARDIMRTEDELNAGADPMSVAYPNPTRDCSWGCDFFPICPMFDDGSRVEDAISALYKVQDPMARYDLVTTNDEGN